MNILYIGGESADFVIHLCNKLSELDNHITCIIQNTDCYERTKINIKVAALPPRDIYTFPKDLSYLDKFIGDKKIDYVCGSHIPVIPYVASVATYLKVPFGMLILDIPTHLIINDKRRQADWGIWLNLLELAKDILFINKINRDEYERLTRHKIPDKNIITYAINQIPKYYKAGLNKNGKNIVTCHRLSPTKNAIFVTEALKHLPFIIDYTAIGRDFGELENIKNNCKKYGIPFKHYKNITDSEKYDIISNSLALIYAEDSKYYGSGLSPWEAMYVGIPAIVPRLESKTCDYGEHAFYYEAGNPKSLADVIINIQNMDKDILNKKLKLSAEYCKKKANFKTMAKNLNNIIKQHED